MPKASSKVMYVYQKAPVSPEKFMNYFLSQKQGNSQMIDISNGLSYTEEQPDGNTRAELSLVPISISRSTLNSFDKSMEVASFIWVESDKYHVSGLCTIKEDGITRRAHFKGILDLKEAEGSIEVFYNED